MLQENITNDQDLEEAVKLRRRQQFEEERKKRIFNAKQRLFGVDAVALQRQMSENERQRSQARALQRHFDEQMENQGRLLHFQDIEQEKRRRVLNSDLNYYRCYMQRKELRREFDLNDPDALKKVKPVRVDDCDMALGVSSAQIFDGEDLGYHERRCRQYEQQRAWLDQQLMEKQRAEDAKRQAEDKWQNVISERERCLEDMTISENRVRAEVLNSVHEYNKKMAQQKRAERERAKQENMEDDLAEIYNMLTSDMLTENPAAGQSSTHPNRRVAYQYRGMTPEEKKEFYRQQYEHKTDLQRRQQQSKIVESEWEQYAENMDRELKLKELELSRREKKITNELVAYNALMAVKQKSGQQENGNVTSRNVITDEFFQQFNTTSR